MKFADESFIPQSRTLTHFLNQFDLKILKLEDQIEYQKEEIEKWRKDYFELQNKVLNDGNQMIANTLKACIEPTIQTMNPAGAMILAHIRDTCHTIEDVHEFIDEIMVRSKEEIANG